ncbi:molybdenum cofactor biosynthesis protein B [Haloferax namakaokahaiae]|uniref:Molybdenum cofactor biosynthesis protein B n=1 Tax=Haloferax namakaokahaiae TaxID=1748331 RepID=A0ABD5ZAC8_9EURY
MSDHEGHEGHDHGVHSEEGDGHHDHDHDHSNHHEHHHHDFEDLSAAVLTISSTRTTDHDPAGDAIVAALHDEGHSVGVRRVVGDDYDEIQSVVSRMGERGDIDITVTTGGTGVTPDDVTVEAVERLFDKTLPGFGELFRRLSFDEIGTRVVGTRATAGIVDETPTFCLPGSENAARLGAESIIVPEAPHLAGLARRDE